MQNRDKTVSESTESLIVRLAPTSVNVVIGPGLG